MIRIVKFIAGMRFFVLIPVVGLAIAAGVLFVRGGFDLVHFLGELVFGGMEETIEEKNLIVEIVEIVHLFLVGTVLFLTSVGLYELFIQPLPLPAWIKTHNIEELELNLVGLTVVVIAVNFLSVIFEEKGINLSYYGIGYALPIAALAYFMKIRAQIKGNESEINENCSFPNSELYENEVKNLDNPR